MLGLNAQSRYYLYNQSADMRKSFDGLSGLVRNHLKGDPSDGSVYIFLNRNRSIIKLLVYDRSGYAIYSKRLERGSFERPPNESGNTGSHSLRWEELMMILEGISLRSVRRRKRYEKPAVAIGVEGQGASS